MSGPRPCLSSTRHQHRSAPSALFPHHRPSSPSRIPPLPCTPIENLWIPQAKCHCSKQKEKGQVGTTRGPCQNAGYINLCGMACRMCSSSWPCGPHAPGMWLAPAYSESAFRPCSSQQHGTPIVSGNPEKRGGFAGQKAHHKEQKMRGTPHCDDDDDDDEVIKIIILINNYY